MLSAGKLLRTLTFACVAFFLSATRGHQCPTDAGFDTWPSALFLQLHCPALPSTLAQNGNSEAKLGHHTCTLGVSVWPPFETLPAGTGSVLGQRSRVRLG